MKQGRAVYDDYYSDDPELIEKTPSRPGRSILGAIALLIAATFFIHSTLAANISLTNGQVAEFGQGTLQTTACSGSTQLQITPGTSFTNISGGGSYALGSIMVTNIPDTCFGSDFILNAYGDTSSAPLAIFNTSSTNAVIFNNSGTFQAGSGSTGMTVSSSSGQFIATFSVPVALANTISKITIQSTAHVATSCALGGTCVVGDTGPGGGKVFYVSVGGFACGPTRSSTCHYLEIAPLNWNGGFDPTRSWAQSSPVDYTSTSLLLSSGIGYGALNTKAIIDQGNSNTATSAAAMAASYSPNINGTTVNDWFLPSELELAEVWNQRSIIGFTATGANYWSSTSIATTNGRYFMFAGGTAPGAASGMTKGTSTNMYLRPVRSF